jgi:hypothetical protein
MRRPKVGGLWKDPGSTPGRLSPPRLLLTALLVGGLLAGGCQRGDERFFVNAFALTGEVAPVVETEEAALYLFEQRILLPLVPPTEAQLERRGLPEPPADQEEPALPFPRLPWIERGDLELQVDWVLTNLTAPESADCPEATAEVVVVLNGVNEFFEYEPGFLLDDDEVIANFAQWERRYVLPPGASVTGTIREEEMDEVTVDLATLVNGAPNPNEVVFRENQFRRDPDVQPFIPEVIPGLVGVKLGLRAAVATCLVLESSVRVRDLAGRLQERGRVPWEIDPPPVVVTAEELLLAAGADGVDPAGGGEGADGATMPPAGDPGT